MRQRQEKGFYTLLVDCNRSGAYNPHRYALCLLGRQMRRLRTPLNVTQRFRYSEGQELPPITIQENSELPCGVCHKSHKYYPKDVQLFIEPGAGTVQDIADRLPAKKHTT